MSRGNLTILVHERGHRKSLYTSFLTDTCDASIAQLSGTYTLHYSVMCSWVELLMDCSPGSSNFPIYRFRI